MTGRPGKASPRTRARLTGLMLWLLIKGVDSQRWTEQAA
jgi:hypothetical protein